jgi:hypothetical protein
MLVCVVAYAAMVSPPGLAAQSPATWTLTPEARIGGADRGKEYEFARIAGVVPGPGGSALVYEFRPPELRAFDADGKYLRTIGRAGGGPGEFRMIGGAGFVGDTLWTVDPELKRVSLFTADGRVTATISQEVADPATSGSRAFSGAYVWFVLPHNAAVGLASYWSEDLASGKVPMAPVLRMTRSARTLDTIAWVSTLHSQLAFTTGTSHLYMRQTFSDTPLNIVAPAVERVFVVDRSVAASPARATFGVVALRVNGDTAWRRRYPYVPKPIPAATADSALSMSIKFGGATITREEVRQQLFLPAFRPPIAAVVAAEDGSLWLRREDGSATVDYTVIGASGNLQATLTVKSNVAIMAVRGDFVWTTEKDEDDVQTVVRYRITRRSGPQP